MNQEQKKQILKQKAINKSEQDKPYFSIEDESIITLTSQAKYADVLCKVTDVNGDVILEGVAESGVLRVSFYWSLYLN